MTDIALLWNGQYADIELDGADLRADDGLETAVVLSLFCDRRADDSDEIPDGSLSRGGFFGDAIAEIENDMRGSRLWLLKRETRRPIVLEKARAYAAESLEWMIEDGVASRVDVTTTFVDGEELGESSLQIDIDIYQPTGGITRFRYAYNWETQLYSRTP